MQRQVIIHPVLFCLYPVLFLYAQSFPFVDTYAVLRSLLGTLALGLLLWRALTYWLKDWYKSGLLTSLALLLVFCLQPLPKKPTTSP